MAGEEEEEESLATDVERLDIFQGTALLNKPNVIHVVKLVISPVIVQAVEMEGQQLATAVAKLATSPVIALKRMTKMMVVMTLLPTKRMHHAISVEVGVILPGTAALEIPTCHLAIVVVSLATWPVIALSHPISAISAVKRDTWHAIALTQAMTLVIDVMKRDTLRVTVPLTDVQMLNERRPKTSSTSEFNHFLKVKPRSWCKMFLIQISDDVM